MFFMNKLIQSVFLHADHIVAIFAAVNAAVAVNEMKNMRRVGFDRRYAARIFTMNNIDDLFRNR